MLKATGNEVNDANVMRMMYAAEAVHMGVLPYAAMKDNMLKYENSAGANRALQMLGNYVQLVKDQRNVDEFMVLLSGEEQNGEAKYSIENIVTKTGEKSYVKADESVRNILHGDDPVQWGHQTTDYINRVIRKGKDVTVITANGVRLTITEDTAGKLAYRNNENGVKYTDQQYALKLRMALHIDDIARVSVGDKGRTIDRKNHSFARDGFSYRQSYFQDYDGRYYSLRISVGTNGNINAIYNINKIKEAELPQGAQGTTANDRRNGITTSEDIKSQTSSEVKENLDIQNDDGEQLTQGLEGGTVAKYSLPEADRLRDAEYQRAVESGDEEKQEKLVKEAAEAAGFSTEEAYHATYNFGFTEFDKELSQDQIFVAFNDVTAQTYTDNGEMRSISDGYTLPDIDEGKATNKEKLEWFIREFKNMADHGWFYAKEYDGYTYNQFEDGFEPDIQYLDGYNRFRVRITFDEFAGEDSEVELNENELVPWLKPSSAAP